MALRQLEPRQVIDRINTFFAENNVCYRFDPDAGLLVKLSSELAHQEMVQPVVPLLRTEGFKDPEDEFQQALAAFRDRDYRTSNTKACSVFESTMKAIATRRGWWFNENMTAKPLVQVMLSNGLLPGYLEAELSGLRMLLEAGVPTLRNKQGAHGQGLEKGEAPEHLAAFVLHTAGASILLLVKSYQALG